MHTQLVKALLFWPASLAAAAFAQAGINSWSGLGPEGGNVAQVQYHATSPSTLYMIAGSQFYRSVDGARSWRSVDFGSFAPSRFAVDPTDPNRVYVIASQRVHVSSDGGAHFNQPPSAPLLHRIVVNAAGTPYGISDDGTVYRSATKGQEWDAVGTAVPSPNLFVADPLDPNLLYITLNNVGFFASADGGANWERRGTDFDGDLGSSTTLVFEASTPTRLWAMNPTTVLTSVDAGVTWSVVVLVRTANVPAFVALAPDPETPGKVFIAQSDGSIVTGTPAGVEFVEVARSSPFPQVLEINPANPSEFLVGGLAGIEVLVPGGFERRNSGVFANNVISLAASAQQDRVYVLLANGVYRLDAGASVTPANNAALYSTFSPLPLTLQRLHVQSGSAGDTIWVSALTRLRRSLDGGETWVDLSRLPSTPLWFASSAGDPQVLYAGTESTVTGRGVIKSLDGGARWVDSGVGLPRFLFPVSGAIGTDPTRLYVGVSSVGVYKSIDAGLSWQPTGTGLAGRRPSNILIDPRDDNKLLVTTPESMFQSPDGGATWNMLGPTAEASESYSGLAVDPTNPQIVYSVTSARLLRSVDAGTTWETADGAKNWWTIRSVLVDPRRPSAVLVGTSNAGVQQYTFAPDLRVELSPPASLVRGSAASYNLRVRNAGPYHATAVRLTLQLPSSAESASFGSTPQGCTTSSATLSCTFDVFPSSTDFEIPFSAIPSEVGAFAVSASITGAQPDSTPSNNSAAVTQDVGGSEPPAGGPPPGGNDPPVGGNPPGGTAPPGGESSPQESGGGGYTPAWVVLAIAMIALRASRRRWLAAMS